jgi:GNAT superfamily N-acetyltransferase
MSSSVLVRQAVVADTGTIVGILREAAAWLTSRSMPMWRASELLPEHIAVAVGQGQFFVAECAGVVAGTIKFQLTDPEFWPDVPQDESAFVHRLAVRRSFAGGAVSSALLSWACDRTGSLPRRFLRLDCEASRPRLRAVYERFGFEHHSDRQVGPYLVARYQLDVLTRASERGGSPAVGDPSG